MSQSATPTMDDISAVIQADGTIEFKGAKYFHSHFIPFAGRRAMWDGQTKDGKIFSLPSGKAYLVAPIGQKEPAQTPFVAFLYKIGLIEGEVAA